MPGYVYLEKQGQFDLLVNIISKSEVVGFDTEFNSENDKYRPDINLIQISAGDQAFCLDPTKGIERILLTICSHDVTLVGHKLDTDLSIFFRIAGKVPSKIVDTQTYAQFLGHKNDTSLEGLTKEALGVQLNKDIEISKSNWAERPLSEAQLAYASSDVIYLERLYTKLKEDLQFHGRLNWAEEECKKLSDPIIYLDRDPETAWRAIKRKEFAENTPEWNVLKCLAASREKIAQNKNLRATSILPDNQLNYLALLKPKHLNDLETWNFKNSPHGNVHAYAKEWAQAVKSGLNIPIEKSIYLGPIPTDAHRNAERIVSLFVTSFAKKNKIDPSLLKDIISSRFMKIVMSAPKTEKEIHDLLSVGGWRADFLTKSLLDLISGEVKPKFVAKNGSLELDFEWNI